VALVDRVREQVQVRIIDRHGTAEATGEGVYDLLQFRDPLCITPRGILCCDYRRTWPRLDATAVVAGP
jgi:hypothetical protein